LSRRATRLAKRAQAESIVPLCQPHTSLIAHQLAMKVFGRCYTQSALEQYLASGRAQKVLSTHNLRDTHLSVIDDTGELVTRQPISPPNHKVAEVSACPTSREETLGTRISIDKTHDLAIRYTKPIVHIWQEFVRCGLL
jgi:hypothetical protein